MLEWNAPLELCSSKNFPQYVEMSLKYRQVYVLYIWLNVYLIRVTCYDYDNHSLTSSFPYSKYAELNKVLCIFPQNNFFFFFAKCKICINFDIFILQVPCSSRLLNIWTMYYVFPQSFFFFFVRIKCETSINFFSFLKSHVLILAGMLRYKQLHWLGCNRVVHY